MKYKYKYKYKYTLFFILVLPLSLAAQSPSFEYVFSQNKSDFSQFAIETRDSNFLIATNQRDAFYPRRSSIIRLNKKGELIKTLTFENDSTSGYIKRIVKTNYGFLGIGGRSTLSKYYLWLVKMDEELNLIHQELHQVPHILQELIADTDRDSNVIIGGSISYKNYTLPRLFGAKVTKNGNLSFLKYQYPSDTSILNINPDHPYVGYFDYMITMKDSARHVFFDGLKIESVDSNFNIVHQIRMPLGTGLSYGFNPTVLRLTDTSYYVAGEGQEVLSSKRTLYYSVMTLGGRFNSFTILGLQDTFEHIATQHSLDTTRNGDIYIGSTFNYPLYCQFCNDTAYFVLYKMDKRQNLLWRKRYGKDGMFVMYGLLTTTDGGCLMYGYRMLHTIDKKMVAYIIKVDGNGVITSETAIPIMQANIIPYPNPSNGLLNFKKGDPSVLNTYEVNLFDMSGKLVFQKKETDLSETFNLTYLLKGNYIYIINQQGKPINTGKWVKMP